MTATFQSVYTPMMTQLHPLTLSFRNPEVERAFAANLLSRLRVQGRAAILVGTLIYLMLSLIHI